MVTVVLIINGTRALSIAKRHERHKLYDLRNKNNHMKSHNCQNTNTQTDCYDWNFLWLTSQSDGSIVFSFSFQTLLLQNVPVY